VAFFLDKCLECVCLFCVQVDIFPTLVQLAGLAPLPLCAPGPTDKQPVLCTEGLSAAPLFGDPQRSWKKAAFSQYPRPAPDPDNGFPADAFSPPLHAGPILPPDVYYPRGRVRTTEGVMSFTMRVHNWRYTEHVWFEPETATPHWNVSWGSELYDHTANAGVPDGSFDDENENVAQLPQHASLVASLSAQLHAGWRAALP
jgi:iduronate 2-sulfatase